MNDLMTQRKRAVINSFADLRATLVDVGDSHCFEEPAVSYKVNREDRRHVSPTIRLISHKNSALAHKELLRDAGKSPD